MKAKKLFKLIDDVKAREEQIAILSFKNRELEWDNSRLEIQADELHKLLEELGIEDIEKMSVQRVATLKHAISMTDIPF